MKKIIYILVILSFCISILADVPISDQPVRCAPEDFQIAPCDYGDWTITNWDEYYKGLYDMGFNLGYFLSNDNLKLAKKYNLKSGIRLLQYKDTNIKDIKEQARAWAIKAKENFPEEYRDLIYYVEIGDEPFMKDIEYYEAYCNACRDIVGVKPYINLNPNYSLNLLGTDSYDEYINTFTKRCNMEYISYDNYSYDIDDGFQEDRYFTNIEDISRLAKENKVPFYNIILSIGLLNYASPTDYSIEYQGWTTLAYGGRGISYYTVITPPDCNSDNGAFDIFGNKTETYNMIKRMNLQIHKIMPYYKEMEHINTFHYGNVPKGCKGIESSVNLKELIVGSKDNKPNIVVGEFKGKKDGKEYIIIVNKNPKYPCCVSKPTFKKGKIPTIISAVNNITWVSNEKVMGDCDWLKPGYGLVIRGD